MRSFKLKERMSVVGLCLSSGVGLDLVLPQTPSIAMSVDPIGFNEDVGGKDMELGENFANSYKNFVSFSEHLGLPMEGFEKEVGSLLRKLEAQKGQRVVGSKGKRRPSPTSQFEREL